MKNEADWATWAASAIPPTQLATQFLSDIFAATRLY
jgi:hypothetical protein